MILCGGDALIDFVPVASNGETAFLPRTGGAVLNAATALARLGEEVAFIGAASTDLFGDMIISHMANESIDHSRVNRTDDDSTLAFVTLSGGEARYAFYDQTSAGRLWKGSRDFPDVDALHIGSVTLVLDPSASAYEDYARHMSERTVLSLDPNCRPGLVDDKAAFVARLQRLAEISHVVRYSDEDFDYLFPDGDESEVASRLLNGVAGLVLISRGAEGATAFTRAGRTDVNAQNVTVRDTIGAGDTFHAGVLRWLSRAGMLNPEALAGISANATRELLEFATMAAALSCTKDGCDPPTDTDVQGALGA